MADQAGRQYACAVNRNQAASAALAAAASKVSGPARSGQIWRPEAALFSFACFHCRCCGGIIDPETRHPLFRYYSIWPSILSLVLWLLLLLFSLPTLLILFSLLLIYSIVSVIILLVLYKFADQFVSITIVAPFEQGGG